MRMRLASVLFQAIGILLIWGCGGRIDRRALVDRNCPRLTAIDTLGSLTVGNGGFAVTVDATGMQTWPELYSGGIPLSTMSHWGWHSFPDTCGYTVDSCLEARDFGRGHSELYACQSRRESADYVRSNPHRLQLGCIGFCRLSQDSVTDICQTLDLWNGVISSSFNAKGTTVNVQTFADPETDAVSFCCTDASRMAVALRFPYPTGAHTDDASDWNAGDRHLTEVLESGDDDCLLRRTIDGTVYYIRLNFSGLSQPELSKPDEFIMEPLADSWSLRAHYSLEVPEKPDSWNPYADARACARWWHSYWKSGAAVDFSHCTDPRAAELERRVVLSQYLTAVQCAAPTPPQETGLTYNSWFGKFHLEMTWWHQAHFALWGHPEMLERTMPWYLTAADEARGIAARQGFDGLRWQKMTDPSGMDTPSDIGTYLIWQQPHPIYLAELLRRAGRDASAYTDLVCETADFMASFACYDSVSGKYVLKGCIPAQETMKPESVLNPPFELSYWHFGLEKAVEWCSREGIEPDSLWLEVLDGLAVPASDDGTVYLAAESEPDCYSNPEMTRDHPAVLGALGMLPGYAGIDRQIMENTLRRVMATWQWDKTWGWDFPLTAMCATRLGLPEIAVDALLMDCPANTYLKNGHNWQNNSLRCYLPGNGGLLTAVALMCAGYDGCVGCNPGFPDGWDVRWEGLLPLP